MLIVLLFIIGKFTIYEYTSTDTWCCYKQEEARANERCNAGDLLYATYGVEMRAKRRVESSLVINQYALQHWFCFFAVLKKATDVEERSFDFSIKSSRVSPLLRMSSIFLCMIVLISSTVC